MEMKLIKINDHFYVVDFNIKGFNINTDSAYYSVKDNDWYKFHDQYEDLTEHDFQITHSTEQLEGVVLLNRSEVEEVINGYSVEKMALEFILDKVKMSSQASGVMIGFIEGFKEHQELTKDKLFTVEDLYAFAKFVDRTKPSYAKQKGFIQSLLPKTEWEVEFDEQGKLLLL